MVSGNMVRPPCTNFTCTMHEIYVHVHELYVHEIYVHVHELYVHGPDVHEISVHVHEIYVHGNRTLAHCLFLHARFFRARQNP